MGSPVLPTADGGVLTVDVAAVVANWRTLGARHPSGPVSAVVKADAYGLGAAALGPALARAGCRHFFVAQLGEGIALRAAIGSGPMIAVLNGFPPGGDGDAALLPVLNGLGDVARHAAAGRGDGRSRAAILHLDTGMARLGLGIAEQARLADDPRLLDGLRLAFVMSHLACADLPEHPMNPRQAAAFAAAADRSAPGVPRSLANSSGLFLGHGYASALARPGCALYGLNPTPARPNPMRPVVRLAVPVLQLRDLAAGETAGYGAAWTAQRSTRIATVAAGYADGYLRSLGGQAVVGSLHARPAPLVGRISMDLTTFDVTDIPAARAGDMMVLMGEAPAPSPDALAAAARTIGYEVLTALGRRYQRRYLNG